jgi:hypothetical protein
VNTNGNAKASVERENETTVLVALVLTHAYVLFCPETTIDGHPVSKRGPAFERPHGAPPEGEVPLAPTSVVRETGRS